MTRWAKLELPAEQRSKVTHLQSQINDLDRILSDSLTLAKKLKENTIDKILAKDDTKVALDVLLGRLKS